MLNPTTLKSSRVPIALASLVTVFLGSARQASTVQPKTLSKKEVKALIATAKIPGDPSNLPDITRQKRTDSKPTPRNTKSSQRLIAIASLRRRQL